MLLDPDQQDLYVFGPPGSGSRSVIIWTDLDPSIVKLKKVYKKLDLYGTVYCLIYDFLYLKTDLMYF